MTDFPAAFDGPWHSLSDDITALLGERLHDFGLIERPRQRVKAARVRDLAFYPGQLLCDIHIATLAKPDAWLSCLYGETGLRALTGESEVIHRLNRAHKPDLSDTALQEEYLKFFCRFVHGQEGPFELITSGGQVEGPAPAPPRFDEDKKIWSATVLYGTALFAADFTVSTSGNVTMEDDVPLAEDIRRNPDVIHDGALRRLRPSEET